ncbi:protein-disulfide isomerase [Thalassotalea aquiviva]|uniref:protein-disulfide isomerase n=1 Tax=Thalassotalea aquiviva TaxID=3242415 RepID=UPI00352B95EF
MNAEIYFIYDSHCPWSYASTALLNHIHHAYKDMPIHLFHVVHYDGSDGIEVKTAKQVQAQSSVTFSENYLRFIQDDKDGTISANLLTWVNKREPAKSLAVLNALQKAHFQDGNPLRQQDDFNDIIKEFKLSPPAKVFRSVLSKDAEFNLAGIAELQELMQTQAFPALLLAKDDNLILLNHNLYLTKPETIVEAVELELKR